MTTDLAGRVAVVTGAGSGLGAASAARLADDGVHVVAVDIDGAAAVRVAGALATESLAVEADISTEDGVSRYMEAGVRRFGRIDAYHLNAGIFGSFAELPDVTLGEFERVLGVNVVGQFLGLRAAFRQFRTQRSRGALVLTASIASLTGSADLIAYQTSKHAVLGLIRGGAVYGGPLGIRVNGVAPGIVPTELFAAAAESTGGKNDMTLRASTTPLRRAGAPEEIASVTAFLLSDAASYITGQVVSADGGATIVNTVRPSGGAGRWDAHGVDRAYYADLPGPSGGAP